jgi:hypothetical protein
MCEDCIAKETALQSANMSTVAQDNRVSEMNRVLEQARIIDSKVQVSSDIFNNETVATLALKQAIDLDESITNKPYALFTEIIKRHTDYQDVIFAAQQTIAEANTKQQSLQVYMNTYANTLRAEERERLHIQDMKYVPQAPSKKSPSVKSPSSKKSTAADYAQAAAGLNKIGLPITAFNLTSIHLKYADKSLDEVVGMLSKPIMDAKKAMGKKS